MAFDANSAQPVGSFDPTTASPVEDGVVIPAAPSTAPKPVTSQWLGFKKGLKLPLDNAAVALESGARSIGLPVDKINQFFGTTSAADVRKGDLQSWADEAKPGPNGEPGEVPGMIGNVAGSIISGLPLTLATKNPWLIGAGTGLLNTEADNPKDAAKDAALGAVVGKAGDVGIKAIGATVSPIWKKTVGQLLSEGVELTPGQITGGALHRIEDAAMSFPIIGDFVRNASDRALKSFNNAGANRVLGQIGEVLPDGIKAGHDAIRYVQGRVDKAYADTLPHMTLDYDNVIHGEIKDLMDKAANDLPADYNNSFVNIIKTRILDALDRRGVATARGIGDNSVKMIGTDVPGAAGFRNGQIAGDAMKQVESDLNAEYRAFAPKGGFDTKYAGYVGKLQDILHDTLVRQNPDFGPKLTAADAAYARLAKLEPPASSAKGGVFTAEALHNAARAGDRSVRHNVSAAGDAMMQDLATAGRDVVSRTVPDSGTIARGVVNGLAGAALFDRAPQLALNPWALGGGAALLAPYTRVGGKIARAAMAGRQGEAWQAARGAVEQAAPPTTIGSAALALYNHNRTRGKYRANGTKLEYQAPGSDQWVEAP